MATTPNKNAQHASIFQAANLIKPMQRLLSSNSMLSTVDHLSHARVFKDDHAFVISSSQDWYLSSYMRNEHDTVPSYHYFDADMKCFLWRNNQIYLKDRASHIAVAREHINIEAAVTVQIKTDAYSDRFIFANTGEKTDLLTRLINHPDMLNKMVEEYYQHANELIHEAEKHKFYINNPLIRQNENEVEKLPTKAINAFLSHALKQDIRLTEKDYLFLILSIYGHKPKEIAKQYFVSFRTVENRLQIIRCKLQCSSTQEVFALLHKTGAFNLYLSALIDKIITI
ncbi:MAG: hypothetical protein A3F10_00655 [Coxiella sp. RIFCSPHIGHO2_12_FULL_42_15]|nr:MAG: hypothetical protein A3F10_00655 [Coxiella sp. RIFCSPHIGHO2_12_FULL_42_15]